MWSVQVNNLLNNCKQNMMSLSLLAGRTVSAKYQYGTLKALARDFTKYALLAITQYVQWSKIGRVKNAVNLSRILFTSFNFFMHILNMFVTYLQSNEGCRRS